MNKQQLGRVWVGIVLLSNLLFLGYLHAYQQSGGFHFGVPEAVIVLVVFIVSVVTVNSVMGWLYMGKPDLRELLVPQAGDQSASAAAGPAATEDD